jgi:transcriptional regulator with XRE-family HTH domain
MASALRVALGHTVRALRSTAGYSQEGFADAIGVHRTYMGTLERGDGNPTLETLELIAQGLRISVSELLHAAETGRLPAISRLNATPARRRRGQQARVGRVAERSDSDL